MPLAERSPLATRKNPGVNPGPNCLRSFGAGEIDVLLGHSVVQGHAVTGFRVKFPGGRYRMLEVVRAGGQGRASTTMD